VGSALIAFHLGAVILWVLAAPSGPWPMLEGPNMATPPQFAFSLSRPVRDYLKLIKMTHNYHFLTNRPGNPSAYLEVRLKDEAGNELATVKFPQDEANFWVRHRQSVLVGWFTDDIPVPPPQSEVVAAPGQQVPTLAIWDSVGPRQLQLKTVPQHLVPRGQPVYRPSEEALLLARSYARYLCRRHGAASAEVVRHSREPIHPIVLFTHSPEPGAVDDLISDFGELPR
jgi:hypothetical protein